MRFLQRCDDFLESKIRPRAWLWALGDKIRFSREFGNCLFYVGPSYLLDQPLSISLCWHRRDNPAESETRFLRELRFVMGAPTLERIHESWFVASEGVRASRGHLVYLPHSDGRYRAANWTGRRVRLRFSWDVSLRLLRYEPVSTRYYRDQDGWHHLLFDRLGPPGRIEVFAWIDGQLTPLDVDYLAEQGGRSCH